MSRVTNYSYSADGLLKQIEMEGRLIQVVRPEDEAIVMEDDAIAVTDASTKILAQETEIRFEVGEHGLIKKMTDTSGKVVFTTYNLNQLPISIQSGDDEITMDYDSDGNMIRRKDEKRNLSEIFEYENGHLTGHKDGEGKWTRWDYEGALVVKKSLVTSQMDVEVVEVVEERKYNSIGRVSQVLSGNGENVQFSYDEYGNVSEVNKDGLIESFVNDAAGNIISNNLDSFTRTFLYDAFNRPLEVTDNNAKTTYKYDQHKRLTEVLQPNGQSLFYKYDVQDRLTAKTDVRGSEWRYDYDEAGNLAKVTKPDGREIEYGYDSTGNAIRISSGDELIENTFDIDRKITRCKNRLVDISRSYELSGLLKEEVYAFDEEIVHEIGYGYDRSGLCTSVKAGSKRIVYDYDDFGNPSQVTSGAFHLLLFEPVNGVPRQFIHDGFWIQKEHYSKGLSAVAVKKNDSEVTAISFGYDDGGNCISKEISGREFWSMKYSASNELVNARLSGHVNGISCNRSFTYDNVGNRITENAFALTYDPFQYQLLEDKMFYYEYDVNGNLSKKTDKTEGTQFIYSYNSFDQLTGFVKKSAAGDVLVESFYGYDGFGRRVRKEVVDHSEPNQSKLKWYLHDGKNVIAELSAEKTITRVYVGLRKLDHLLGFIENGQPYYYVTGKFQSVEAIIDNNGDKVAQYSYGAFGELLDEESEIENDFLYIGREYDRELQAYYLRARHYDPYSGRFFQVDPDAGKLLNPRTILLKYAYANNNPFKYFDPEGKSFDFGLFFGILALGLLFATGVGAAIGAIGIGTFLGTSGAIWGGLIWGGGSFSIGGFALIGGLVGGLIGGLIADDVWSGGELGGDDFWAGFSKGAQIGAVIGACIPLTFSAEIIFTLWFTLPISIYVSTVMTYAYAEAADQPWILSEDFWE